MALKTTTCQICGRAIKANTGLIAHHGYRMPWGTGERTQSCPGSRHQPYELNRELIPHVLRNYQTQRDLVEQRAADWVASPPPEIKAVRKDAWGRVTAETILSRPEDFDLTGIAEPFRGGFRMTYAREHAARLRTMRTGLAALTEAIAFLTERYDNWKPPA